jgi:hypothetical protein
MSLPQNMHLFVAVALISPSPVQVRLVDGFLLDIDGVLPMSGLGQYRYFRPILAHCPVLGA